MPFDGVVLKSIVNELKEKLNGGRIDKIFQPESDEIFMNIRSQSNSYRLLMCSNASMPRVNLTSIKKENPMSAPNFCMVLRKHLQGAKIIDINSFGYERIFAIDVETYSELQDRQIKRLIVEIMGKHSNIILVNENNKIIDSIKHIDNEISSVREVMPARPYSLPPAQDKVEPDTMDVDAIFNRQYSPNKKTEAFILESIMGFSPFLARNICYLSGVDPKLPIEYITPQDLANLKNTLLHLKEDLINKQYSPCVLYDEHNKNHPIDFYCFTLANKNVNSYSSISEVVDEYYISKDLFERLKQKKSDLTKTINNAIDKNERKVNIYNENIRESAVGDKYKLYGDLILAFIHSIPPNSDKITLSNFYSDNLEDIEVPLDPTMTPQQTATIYYKKYNKAKNTLNNSTKLLTDCYEELSYLENVQYMLEHAQSSDEIEEIRNELINVGLIFKKNVNKKASSKKSKAVSQPHHFISSDRYDIFVGKNNIQNDLLTLKSSISTDIWLHTKDIPGSHVIIKKQKDEIPTTTIYEAALLASHFSKARSSSKVPVDYTLVKFVKKPQGSKPGKVIYTNQKTLFVTPDEEILNKLLNNVKDVK